MSSRPRLTSLDAFAKTVEDAKVKTASGGIITLVCVLIVLVLIRNEYTDYTRVINRPELVVDRDINKKMDINIDISFPNIPCDILSLDLLDESGDVQLDILSSGFQKYRITKTPSGQPGQEILIDDPALNNGRSLQQMAAPVEGQECGSCYGALPQDNNQYCCNNCETVKLAYAEKLWGFFDGENIEQCEREGYVKNLNERIRNNEGCRVKGTTQINRISGTLDFAPGASFTSGGRHVHDLSLFNKYDDKFNFDHTIHHLSFGRDSDSVSSDLVESTHPLDGFIAKVPQKQHVTNYYLKVVATRFEYLDRREPLNTNQFSVITHNRPLQGGKDEDHEHTIHARGGVPGVGLNFDISPLKIINREQYAKTWSGFVLGVISSVAGVLMVGTVFDRSVWAAEKAIKGKKDL